MGAQVFTFDATVSLSLLFSVATVIFSWWRTREDRAAKQVAEVRSDVTKLDLRVTEVERIVAALPGSKELNALVVAITEVKGELRTMSAVINGQQAIMERIESSVSRHEDHLRQHG